ncbi:carbohydrate ABC transporter permease [Paenibacillus silvisoli]|uniref:carbohydrate ABC transporter permease n=1 Tax=Paenibacillus silvisoli TaxID=3110539 RepID=UPI002805655D|nr:carbohydrate ABC transporter permease [Paenibacillus silvisoli]
MKRKKDPATILFQIIAYSTVTILTVLCLLPFWLVVIGSFTTENEIIGEGFKLWPNALSLDAYHAAFSNPKQILQAYWVTTWITFVGSIAGLFLTSMAGYVLSRGDFKYRNSFAFFMYFTTLFGGGLIPWYILIVKYLALKDSYLVMIIPSLISAWNIILMKNFMKSIPDSIVESARIDGANDFTIYTRLIMPLSTPGLATIGLFLALGYWNDWFTANIFITTEAKYPLQFFLYKILANAAVLRTNIAANLSAVNFTAPAETLKMAVAVIVTGPIVFLYPFIQKYFVKGLTIGAVKG